MSDYYDQAINSIIETMPYNCYEYEQTTNSLHITDLGIQYLGENIFNAHLQAGHCVNYEEGAYKFEANQLAARIVFNPQKNCPKLKDCDLNILDLEDSKYREARLMKFMLSDNGESSVICEQNQKKPNPMRQAGYFEE